MKVDFSYKEIVRSDINGRMKVVGHINKCRSGYFYRSKSGGFRSSLFKSVGQLKDQIKSGKIDL